MELGGFEFKPHMNKKSIKIANVLGSLSQRMPELMMKKAQKLENLIKESENKEIAECRPPVTNKISQLYLRKSGKEFRSLDDLFKFKEEKLRRQFQRQQIVEEVSSQELTFRPQLNMRTEKLMESQSLPMDPCTRLSVAKSSRSLFGAEERFQEGSPLVLDSDHPYKHSANEYILVNVPGAAGYSVTFSDNTATELIYDYIKFFKDDSHTDFWGQGKYSGGAGGAAGNWPGQGSRPALEIPAPKFIVHFRSNASGNDWGFRMVVVPMLLAPGAEDDRSGSSLASARSKAIVHQEWALGQPSVSSVGRNYRSGDGPVHQRLYRQGLDRRVADHNQQVQAMQSKLNLPMKPWETNRQAGSANPWAQTKTHLAKSANAAQVEECVVDDDADIPVFVVEFDDALGFLWRALRQLSPTPGPLEDLPQRGLAQAAF